MGEEDLTQRAQGAEAQKRQTARNFYTEGNQRNKGNRGKNKRFNRSEQRQRRQRRTLREEEKNSTTDCTEDTDGGRRFNAKGTRRGGANKENSKEFLHRR